MATKGLVGMGRIVLSNRERPILVEPMGLALRGFTLRYAHEVRSEAEYVASIPPITLPKEMAAIAEHLLETKREDFDPTYLKDRYRMVLVEKLREKRAKLPTRSVAPAPSPKNVINLMESLKRSLAAGEPAHTAAAKSMPRPGARPSKPPSSKRPPAGKRKRG
jgi:DNA end-binding protein Ku